MSETSTQTANTNTDQSPEDKFVRLANKRGDKFLHICKLLRNLGDSYAYTVEPALAEELLEKFESKLEEVRISWTREIAKVRRKQTSPEASE